MMNIDIVKEILRYCISADGIWIRFVNKWRDKSAKGILNIGKRAVKTAWLISEAHSLK